MNFWFRNFYPVSKRRVNLQNIATNYTTRIDLNKIEEVDDLELLPHPAYSPDLTPSNYYFFHICYIVLLFASSFVVLFLFLRRKLNIHCIE